MPETEPPETPNERIPQDPGIAGRDTVSDVEDAPIPDEHDPAASDREALEDPDREGHMGAGSP